MTDEALPGLEFSRVAASAYRAYAASTGNKNFRGEPMPKFEDLPRPIQVAWEAAVRHVNNLVINNAPADLTDSDLAELETDWAGWTPP